MGLLVAFGTDDGIHLNDDHVGMANEFHVYEFSGASQRLLERRQNTSFAGDESMKHGDPAKAKATTSVLANVDVLVGKKFGPNLPRLLKNFVCVVVRTDDLKLAIDTVRSHMEEILEQKDAHEARRHIVLRP
jgi:predicted Fe-Mo cluster-binding NifX family protein